VSERRSRGLTERHFVRFVILISPREMTRSWKISLGDTYWRTDAAKTLVHALMLGVPTVYSAVHVQLYFASTPVMQCSATRRQKAKVRHYVTDTIFTTSTGCQCDNISTCEQVPSLYGTVVPGRYMHVRVVDATGRQHLRSAAHGDLIVPRSRLTRYDHATLPFSAHRSVTRCHRLSATRP